MLGTIFATAAGLFVAWVIAWVGWMLYRIARVTSYGAILTDCRDPDCDIPGDRHYILRHRSESFDLKLHGHILGLLDVWEDALKKGIVRNTGSA